MAVTQIWQALDRHGLPLLSVIAADEQSARLAITEQLWDLHGREVYYWEWDRAGRPVRREVG